MRAMRAEEFRGYEGLKPVDLPKPAVSDGKVLVRMIAAGVTPLEHTILFGNLPRVKAPLVLGGEGAGVVEGGGGTDFPVGSRVMFTGPYGVSEKWGLWWISTFDKLEALKPKAVVAGHKVPENDDDPRIIAETRQYLRDFNRLKAATVTARQLYDAMLDLYPDRVNPGSLWGTANTAKKQA
jgi:hypothetical protein